MSGQAGARESAAETAPAKSFLPRWAKWLIVPGMLGPLLILGFIFRTELAHDESRCPFANVSEQAVSETTRVREDRRSCLSNVEERRFTLVRPEGERVLGRRRLPPEAFSPSAYQWDASLLEDGQVHVRVRCEGHPDAEFREGTAQERGH